MTYTFRFTGYNFYDPSKASISEFSWLANAPPASGSFTARLTARHIIKLSTLFFYNFFFTEVFIHNLHAVLSFYLQPCYRTSRIDALHANSSAVGGRPHRLPAQIPIFLQQAKECRHWAQSWYIKIEQIDYASFHCSC